MSDVSLEIQVRYNEVDQMGIAHHPRYFTWFEMARIALLDGVGLPYGVMEREGIQLPLVHAEARYRRPLRFGDWFRLEAEVVELTPVRVGFAYRIHVGEALATEARTDHAAVAAATGRPRRLPAGVLEALATLPSRGGDRPPIRRRDPATIELVPG